jgi:hypothetical protein
MKFYKKELSSLNEQIINENDRQNIEQKIPSALCILGTVNYTDVPGIFTI